MNEIIQALHNRKSVRVFTEEAISAKDRESIWISRSRRKKTGWRSFVTNRHLRRKRNWCLYSVRIAESGLPFIRKRELHRENRGQETFCWRWRMH